MPGRSLPRRTERRAHLGLEVPFFEHVPITEARLRELIATDEGQFHDLKSTLQGAPGQKKPRPVRNVSDEIAEYVAGFLNSDGGTLIVGVEDDGTISGHRYDRDDIQQLLAVPKNRLNPPQGLGTVHVVDGHELLVFEVESAPRAVMVVGDGFPYRIGDKTLQHSEQAINAYKDQGLIESAEARPASASIDDLDTDLIARARDAAGLQDLSVGDYLVRRRLADYRGTSLVLREAAVLLFARVPEAIAHPNAGVRVFRVAGTERLTGHRHNVQEFPRAEGNLPALLREVRALLDTLIQKSAKLHDLFFQEMPEYPMFAWQEALVNAVAHRDYSIQSRSIEVWLFEDRLEVKSPGALLHDVPLASLRQGRPAHATRNPRIVRVLVELGLMREQGEGIPRMFEEMGLSYLPFPQIELEGGWFHVTLRNTPIFQSADPEWSKAVRQLELPVTQKRALVALADREFANADYCELNRVDRDTAYREIHELVEKGLLSPGGVGAGMRYRVIRSAIRPAASGLPPIDRLVERMKDTGFITNADYRDAFGVSRQAATDRLARWVQEKVLVREGERRGARYRAGRGWPPRSDAL